MTHMVGRVEHIKALESPGDRVKSEYMLTNPQGLTPPWAFSAFASRCAIPRPGSIRQPKVSSSLGTVCSRIIAVSPLVLPDEWKGVWPKSMPCFLRVWCRLHISGKAWRAALATFAGPIRRA